MPDATPSVDAAFRDSISRITPSDAESIAVARHRESIHQCLASGLPIRGFFRTGSFGLGTSIRAKSDVDYFVSLASLPDDVTTSTDLLRSVLRVLRRRFSQTPIRMDSPALVIPFGLAARGPEVTEIVPAIWSQWNGEDVYQIPDGNGGWMWSAPHLHNNFVRAMDVQHGDRVRPLVRFLKRWSLRADAGIKSFYLELFVAAFAQANGLRGSYPEDLRDLLYALMARRLAPFDDPMGISLGVTAFSQPRSEVTAIGKLRETLTQAILACDLAARGYGPSAMRLWRDKGLLG